LIADLHIARSDIAREWSRLERGIDVPGRIGKAVRNNQPAWLGGSAIAGFALFRLLLGSGRKNLPKVGPESATARPAKRWAGLSWLLAAGKLGFELAKPWIADLAAEKIAQMGRASGARATAPKLRR
jgi:hypothetical protein